MTNPEQTGNSDSGVNSELAADLKAIQTDHEKTAEKQSKPRVFLEIGPWLSSVALKGNRHFTGKDVYIGLEKSIAGKDGEGMSNYDEYAGGIYELVTNRSEQVRNKKDFASTTARNKHVAETERPGENINFMYGDMKHIPLPDGSVHEVFAGNVMGQNGGEFHSALPELSRVLEEGGHLVIKETTTPLNPKLMIGEVGALFGDFVVEQLIYGSTPEYELLNKKYGENMDDLHTDREKTPQEQEKLLHPHYYAVLRKLSDQERSELRSNQIARKKIDVSDKQGSEQSTDATTWHDKTKQTYNKIRGYFRKN